MSSLRQGEFRYCILQHPLDFAALLANDRVVERGQPCPHGVPRRLSRPRRDNAGHANFDRRLLIREQNFVQALARSAVDTFGGLDCAVNCAGIEGPRASIADYAEADWIKLIGMI